jgi:hypothetical protein
VITRGFEGFFYAIVTENVARMNANKTNCLFLLIQMKEKA